MWRLKVTLNERLRGLRVESRKLPDPEGSSSFDTRINEETLARLNLHGYAVGCIRSQEDLLAVAYQLGTPISMRRAGPLIQELRPATVETSTSNSLTARHGLSEFPFHTDCAFWEIPARYTLLRSCSNSTNEPTLLADYSWIYCDESVINRMQRAIFKVINGRKSFLTTSIDLKRRFVRVDRDCMIPANSESSGLFEFLEGHRPINCDQAIHWTTDCCVIIDNWRMVHARHDCSAPSASARLIKRVLVRT